jgi:RNA polymerase sigma factor (sigma-70 family)
MPRVPLSHAERSANTGSLGVVDTVALDDALTRLGELDERQASIVEMRVFGGMTHPEIASVLGVSEPTVKREWRAARAWLGVELRED